MGLTSLHSTKHLRSKYQLLAVRLNLSQFWMLLQRIKVLLQCLYLDNLLRWVIKMLLLLLWRWQLIVLIFHNRCIAQLSSASIKWGSILSLQVHPITPWNLLLSTLIFILVCAFQAFSECLLVKGTCVHVLMQRLLRLLWVLLRSLFRKLVCMLPFQRNFWKILSTFVMVPNLFILVC